MSSTGSSAGSETPASVVAALFLVGPTAVGKTAVAIELALRLGGEIVSADSMQVYRGLDIITAKPTLAEREIVPHHLIDVLDPRERCDAALYSQLAKSKVEDIRRRGKLPIVVGGSGMYVRALADGLFGGPGMEEGLRAELEAEAEGKGLEYLYSILRREDPVTASRIHPSDKRRIVRALEILRAAGKRPSELRRQWKEGGFSPGKPWFSENLGCACFFIGLRREREDLRKRISERVRSMLAGGAIKEVRTLLRSEFSPFNTVRQMLGLKEIHGLIEGRYGMEDAREMLEKATRAYAKRQMTWFRKDKRIAWFDIGASEDARAVARRIMTSLAAWLESGSGRIGQADNRDSLSGAG